MIDQQENLLTVQVGERDADRQAYPVRVTLGDGSAASDWLRLGDLPPAPTSSSGAGLSAYGVLLFELLFSGPLHGLFRQAWIIAQRERGVLHMQLWIQSGDAALQAVPWELMHIREGAGAPIPLAATPQVAFSRYVDSATPFGRPIERWPLRILVVIGAPDDLATRWPDLAPVSFDAERDRLSKVLGVVSASGQISYRFLRPATPEALVQAMEDGYQIVIFYGHGLYVPRKGTSLLMQREDGSCRLFEAGELIDALRRIGSRPALFILISCNTAAKSADPALDNLAIQIIRDGSVPAVVAMRDLVEVDLARAFTQYLCDYLLRYGVIDRAVAAARRQVLDPNRAGWSTPVLYMRSQDGRLFVPNAQLEFARLLSNDPQIRQVAVAAPAGPRLALLRARPDEQPNPQDARAILDQLLALGGRQPSPAPIIVSGGSRISRSLLLQQWGWQQNQSQESGVGGWELGAEDRTAQDVGPSPQPPAPSPQPPTPNLQLPTPIIAVYLSLADDRRLQAGAQIEDLLIDAAADVDPAHGVALMNLLGGEQRSAGARFVLLIDGFEAISPSIRSAIATRLDGLSRSLPDQRIVISVAEHDAPAALQQGDMTWLMLSPLRERQMRAYLAYRDRVRSRSHMQTIISSGMRDLAADPQLLTAIAEDLVNGGGGRLSRDSMLSGLLDKLIDRASGPTVSRVVVRTCIYALAWAMHWGHRDSLSIAEAFQVIRDVPQDRSYAPENIYRALVSAGALVEVGGISVQLSHLELQAYAAARALRGRPDMRELLGDIMVIASFPSRLAWWSPVLIGVAQRVDTLGDLAPIWAMLRSEVSGPQAILAARCLGAFTQAQRQSLSLIARLRARSDADDEQRAALLDSILIELNPRFEPSASSRAMLVETLAQLPYPKVREALRRQIGERVLLIDDNWQYDRPMVRMAAARSLRDMTDVSDGDAQLNALLTDWRWGWSGRLLAALDDPEQSTEARILAALALSDLSDQDGVQRKLVDLLLRDDVEGPKKDWQAVQAAIADALVLEADAQLAGLMSVALERQPKLPLRTEILAVNVVGACASHEPALLSWLYARLDGAPIPLISGMARLALARALACGPVGGMPGTIDSFPQQLEAQARAIIEEEITADAPMVATLRRLAIECLVWLGATGDGTPPEAITTWPVALRQSWWESVGG
ncbi:CHAT domain-containing protein [Oscillochloris sp. ZM17-4]|uniref:CHAT domain-containing protein n=1 Tax=Oscillochloris sp. ZM17-4 TaxID=2866714 RepID=UPI001C72B7CB|nr:CHAT domain-containing protein [Oscillochloris sp. ZM17-4]MBX0328490.1 CHAT domain-containing protein [Oscillochloris sp. ZM17-4]